MQVDAFIVTQDRVLTRVDAQEMSDDWFGDGTVRWIKITSASPEEVERALRPLDLNPRIVRACANPEPPQVEVLEKVLFMSMPLWTPEPGSAALCVRFLGIPTTLITIQDAPMACLDMRAERLLGEQCLCEVSTAALTLDLVEAMFKALIPAYVALRAEVERTAEKLELRPGEVGTDELISLKRRATHLSITLEDYLHCLAELREARSETLRLSAVRAGFQDLVGHFERGQKRVARMEDRIRDLRQSSLNYLQEATNRRLKILTMLSAVYLPPTLIAAIYGMNFENIPITRVPYGYFVVLGLMLSLVVGQIWFFYRRGWFR